MNSEDKLTRSEWKLNVVQSRFAHEGEVLDFRLSEAMGKPPLWTRTAWVKGEPESVNAQGISRTEEMWLYLDATDGGGEAGAARLLEGLDRESLRAVVDPRWMALSGAFYEIHHQDRENHPMEERIYELVAYSYGKIIERLGLYGMWIFGDIAAWSPQLPNREPALYRAFRKAHLGSPFPWVSYARSGDHRLLKFAEQANRQLVDASYCHYVSDDVQRRSGDAHPRAIGYVRVGPVPWGYSATSPPVRSMHNKCKDHWYAYYMTGYHRSRDNILSWIEQTKIEDRPGSGAISRFGRSRGPTAMLKSYIETYEATFDPWFLVAAHAISEDALQHYADGGRGRSYSTGNREFLRYTGSERFREWYEAFAGRHADPAPPPHEFRWMRRHQQLAPKSYMYHLTGEQYYARRVRHAIDFGTFMVRDGPAEPDYLQGYVYRGHNTGYILFSSYYLRWFPAGLRALEEAGKQVDPIPNAFSITVPPSRAENGEMQRRLVLALRKESQEPLPINLRARSTRLMTNFRGDADAETRYAMTGPHGEAVLEGAWRMGDDIQVEVGAEEPGGVYRLELHFPDDEGDFVLPVSDVDTPEVVVRKPDEPMVSATEGTFWFMVPDGMSALSTYRALK